MDFMMEYLPILLPLLVLQLGLAIFALVHVLRHPHYRFGNKVLWIILVCFVSIIGPVVYFVWGRGEDV